MLTTETRERDFPSLKGITYLNTAAEGIPPQVVGQSLDQYFADKLLGMDGRDAHFAQWNAARELVGTAFGLSAAEVSICFGGVQPGRLGSEVEARGRGRH